jgi:N-acetylglucosaminyldiphosphoundecaprenol N-acetyl-beta-D-mannosaminyltransferase
MRFNCEGVSGGSAVTNANLVINPQPPATASVLGLPLHLMEDYGPWLRSRLAQHQGTHVVTLNAEMAMQGEQNPDLATVIQQAELVIPDGAGVVLYLRLRGQKIQRCPGIELAESLLTSLGDRSTGKQPQVFFYGGAPGVSAAAAQCWQDKFPGLAIASQHGFLSEAEQQQLKHDLHQNQPDVILVGMGVPRQEFWIAENRHLCPNAIWIGVGGSFDIWAGVKSRAPRWLRDNHLEWVYRLYREPWRWRRMLALPKFAWRALAHSSH